MPPKSAVPDAWDDDWESLADVRSTPCVQPDLDELIQLQKQENSSPQEPHQEPQKISRAERKAQHAEANRQLWESA